MSQILLIVKLSFGLINNYCYYRVNQITWHFAFVHIFANY